MSKILATGSIAFDLLLSFDGSFEHILRGQSLDKLSVSFFSPHAAKHHGGTGANIVWNLALLQQPSLLVASLGQDGEPYKNRLTESGIDTRFVTVDADHMTATAVIGTDSNERQIAFFHPGADSVGTWPTVDATQEDITHAVVGARDLRLMQQGLDWCAAQKVWTLFDPGQQIHAFGSDDLRRIMQQSQAVIANDFEWNILSECSGWSAKEVLAHCELLIVTHGEHGCSVHTRDGEDQIDACPVIHMINPTGAGDAFRAGLLTGLVRGWDVKQAAQLGAGLASFVVEIEGTQLPGLPKESLLARLKKTYGKEFSF